MRKSKRLLLLAPILCTSAVSLFMLNPEAVSLAFASGPTEVQYISFSYYALTPLGYGMPFPFLSASLTLVALLIGGIAYFRPRWKRGMFVCLIGSFLMSVLTVFFSKHISIEEILVSGLLICTIILLGIQLKEDKNCG